MEVNDVMRPVLGPAVGILASILLTLLATEWTPSAQAPAATSTEAVARTGKAALDGIQLAYEVRGAGEPVVLVHAGGFADWFKPLIEQRALTDRYRVISYHRIGYGDSSRVSGTVTLIDQAAQLRALLRHLGIARAHVVGHSSGGNIALQLALDAPEMVATLALLEPAMSLPVPVPVPPNPSIATTTTTPPRAFISAALAQFRAGDKSAALDTFMRGVAGADYRVALDARLPGAFAQGVVDADTFFGHELTAVQQWRFTRDEARRISQPVLAITGERSAAVSPVWPQRQALLLEWLPNAEGFVLPGATHLLHVQNPRGTADRLVTFLGSHKFSKKQ
jgi:pimeloyl-ACP methyl ester carboxylesterase